MAAFAPTSNPCPAVATGVGPQEAVLVASGAYTATASQEFRVLGDASIIAIRIDTTDGSAAPSTVPTVEYFDVAKQGWLVLLTGAAIVATGTVQLLVGPHANAATNLAANTALYRRMRITMTHGNANSHTYSISVASTLG